MREKHGVLLTVILVLAVILTIGGINRQPVQAESLAVTICGTKLQDGYYTANAEGTGVTYQGETVPSGVNNYLQYSSTDGSLTITGFVTVKRKAEMTDACIQVENGTLLIKGSGGMRLDDSERDVAAHNLIESTTKASIRTENYSGDLWLYADGTSMISGFATVELKTSGVIVLSMDICKDGQSGITADSIELEAEECSVSSGINRPHALDHLFCATGDIRITTIGGKIKLYTISKGTMLKGRNIYLTPAADEQVWVENICEEEDAVAVEGNLIINGTGDIRVAGKQDVLKGNLTVAENNPAGVCTVTLKSEHGTAVAGDVKIDRAGQSVNLVTEGDCPAVIGNIDVNSGSLKMSSRNNSALVGNLKAKIENGCWIYGGGDYPVVRANQFDMGNKGGIFRYGEEERADIPMLDPVPKTGRIKMYDGYNQGNDTYKKVYFLFDGAIYDSYNCPHPKATDAGCIICGASLGTVEVIVPGSEKRIQYDNLSVAFRHIKNGTLYSAKPITLLFMNDYESSATGIYDAGRQDLILDLNGHQVEIDEIQTQANLTLTSSAGDTDGQSQQEAFTGAINNACVDFDHTLRIENVNATLNKLNWQANGGLDVSAGSVTISNHCFTEKMNMDRDSIIRIIDVAPAISNYGKLSLEESLGGIEEYLPKGYSISRQRPYPSATDTMNLILDADGNVARGVELRYRRMSDAEVQVTVKPLSYVYDKTAKEPAVTVVYGQQDLIEGEDYTVSYRNNVNAGTAVAIIQGKGIYHEEQTVNFTIEKAQQAAPTGLTAGNATQGQKDGVIRNTAADMEYSENQTDWTAVAGTTITGLAAGDYYVRYAEKPNYYASPATKVTVGETATTTENGSSETTEGGSSEAASTEADSTGAASTADTTASGKNNVKTGDEMPVAMMIVLALMSIGAAVVVGSNVRKK